MADFSGGHDVYEQLDCSIRELSRSISCPHMRRWLGSQRLLRYHARAVNINIRYNGTISNGEGNMLTGYSDSDWDNGIEKRSVALSHLLRWWTSRMVSRVRRGPFINGIVGN